MIYLTKKAYCLTEERGYIRISKLFVKRKGYYWSIDTKLNTAKKGKIDMNIFNYFKRLKRFCLKVLKNQFGYGGFTKVVQEKIAKVAPSVQDNRFNKENKGPQNTR